MAFVSFVGCLLIFFYLFVILFYDPKVVYDETHIYFKKFSKAHESISLKQVVRLSQNMQSFIAYGGTHSKYHYRIDYINYNGKSRAISFYSEVSQEMDIKELIASIRGINPYFIIDWTVPKKSGNN